MRRLLGLALVCSWALTAQAAPRQVNSASIGGGGESSGGGVTHFGASGAGMAVGTTTGAGVEARHGVLAGQPRDEDPPEITSIDDLVVPTLADRCAGIVELPPVVISDARDRNPTATVTLRTNPPQQIDIGGEVVELPLGSYDVVIVAEDRYGNTSQASYRIDVVDRTAPTIQPVADPTPIGGEAEATSPIGTPVAVNYGCVDACDPAPVSRTEPSRPRYPVGNTVVQATCTDRFDNVRRAPVVIRVRDTGEPALVGELPPAIDIECNSFAGADIEVPRLLWNDLGSPANQLTEVLIVDPAGVATRHSPIPARVTLNFGEHVLRYEVTDANRNTAHREIAVDVQDHGAPTIRVVNTPENGWSNAVGTTEIELEVVDRCQIAADLDVSIQPAPAGMRTDGNRVFLTYGAEGVYALGVTVEDQAGNTASDNSIAFGIDRGAPVPIVRVPSQLVVDDDDPLTYPVFAKAEYLPLNVGGEDESDGLSSGMARVTVVLDPDGSNRTLAVRNFEGNGIPVRGQRVVGNVGCEMQAVNVNGVQVHDGFCDADAQIDLRNVPTGVHYLEVTVRDYAGNEGTSGAYFISADLHGGFTVVMNRVGALLGDAGAARIPLQRALQGLIRGRDVSELDIDDSTYDTPVFLGTALRASQDATISMVQAFDASEGALHSRIAELTALQQRLARSELVLMTDYVTDLRGEVPDGMLRRAYDVDMDLVDTSIEIMEEQEDADSFNQAAATAMLGYFHAKSAHSNWIMDFNFVPVPANRVAVLGEYERGRDMLQALITEMNVYLTLESKPAENTVRQIRDRLTPVVADLTTLVEQDFDGGEGGLTDEAYVHALLDLRDVANFTLVAGNQSAYVRNYQWAMMQVVRFMTQASMEDAIFFRGGGRPTWPIYVAGLGYVDEGVEYLDARRVQSVINLYGENPDSICLVIAVYHCDFLDDEGNDDTDRIVPEIDTPEYCWDRMVRPSEWDEAPYVGGRAPQCQYTVIEEE